MRDSEDGDMKGRRWVSKNDRPLKAFKPGCAYKTRVSDKTLVSVVGRIAGGNVSQQRERGDWGLPKPSVV